jgi:hypothetical protein
MRKLLVFVFCVSLLMPLYAQDEKKSNEKKSFDFSRKKFEIGINAGFGVDNDVIKANDIFKKNIVIDLDNFGNNIEKGGMHFNVDLLAGFFINTRMQEKWGFGFSSGLDGGIYGRLPESIFTLVTEGNINSHYFTGTTNASGAVYSDISLSGFFRLGKLRIGFRPSMYVPLIYIPKDSRITYILDTEEGIKLEADGNINVYTPYNLDGSAINISDIYKSGGFDISLDLGLDFSSAFGIGVSLAHIPLAASKLRYVNRYNLDDFTMDLTVDDIMNGGLEFPSLDFKSVSEECEIKVQRPLRFDVFALFRPLSFNRNLIVIKPRFELSFDIIDKTALFGGGLEIQTHLLRNMISLTLASGLSENIWKHQLAFALNLRAFELDLSAALRSQSIKKSFQGSGTEFNVGLRFGW